ncbi:MAG: phosphoesterase, MJ0936 family [halophilic archaeon J07HX64]|nr:MAG: phosphoesterase, MJ0936 family [halophilic archaeon J07HX64]
MQVALISDTHIPSRASEVPTAFAERVRTADHTLHAGDFDSKGAFATVRAMAGAEAFTAVSGNMDRGLGLPDVRTVEFGGVEFVVTHGTGPAHSYRERVADTVRAHAETDSAVGVAGHTHEPLDTHHDGVRLLNPGSVTDASPAERATMMTATVDGGELTVQLHER